jgi:hypothetical protein
MRIHEILNYNSDQRAFQSIANAFAPNGMLKFLLDFEGMSQVSLPVQDHTAELFGDHNLDPVTQGSDIRSAPFPASSRGVIHPGAALHSAHPASRPVSGVDVAAG